ncbi:MAG: hypothetical protein Kow00121_30100 [Elainellaceae cyanobacterium]
MTGQPPPDPRSSRNRELGFDELIAIFVSLTAIGSILFWGLTRGDEGFSFAPFSVSEAADPTTERVPASEGLLEEQEDAFVPFTDPSPRVVAPIAPGIVREETPSQRVTSLPPRRTVVPESSALTPTPVIVAPPPTAAAIEFSDLSQDYWAYPFIINLSQRGIIRGLDDGTFRPDQPVTRAEFAAMLNQILPDTRSQAPIAFSDVPSGYWATPAIDAAVQTGFLRGYPEGDFQPEQPVTKVQVLASLVNGMGLAEVADPGTAVQRFADTEQIPDWAVPVTGTATQSGLVVNYPNPEQLNPNQPATRAEVATMIYQALEATDQVEPIQSQYIVQP